MFTAQPLTTSQPHQHLQLASGNGKPSSLHGGHQKGSVQSVLRNTPKTIPKLVNMNASTVGPTKPRTQSTSHVNSQSMQYSSRVAGSVKQSPASTTNQKTPVLTTNQHTPKQDTVKPPLRSATVPCHMVSGVSPHKKKPGRQAKHNHTTGPLEEVVPEQPLPRKLFSSEAQREGSSGVNSDNVCLQNLFSQSLPSPLERNSTGSVSLTCTLAPIKPMSLAEIEKQMSDEVPSPDKTTPFSLIPSHSTSGSTTAILSSSAPESKLLQPSAFSATPPTGTAATPPPAVHSAADRNRSSSVSVTPSSGLTLKSDLDRSSTTASIFVSVEPPTPGVSSLMNGVFPNVPPLMHSAGMRAPPVTTSTVQQITQTQSAVASAKESKGERGKNGRGSPMGKNGRGSPMGKRGGGKGGKTSRGGSRSPGPERSRTTPSPQSGQDVGVTPSRSFSLPGHVRNLLYMYIVYSMSKEECNNIMTCVTH